MAADKFSKKITGEVSPEATSEGISSEKISSETKDDNPLYEILTVSQEISSKPTINWKFSETKAEGLLSENKSEQVPSLTTTEEIISETGTETLKSEFLANFEPSEKASSEMVIEKSEIPVKEETATGGIPPKPIIEGASSNITITDTASSKPVTEGEFPENKAEILTEGESSDIITEGQEHLVLPQNLVYVYEMGEPPPPFDEISTSALNVDSLSIEAPPPFSEVPLPFTRPPSPFMRTTPPLEIPPESVLSTSSKATSYLYCCLFPLSCCCPME